VFLPGLIASGAGLGFVWTPVFSLGTRDLRPELGGVASGVINTIMELGGVVAGAAIGALLQNRLAVALQDQAVRHSSQVPEQFRAAFLDAFRNVGRHGLQVGAGEAGAAVPAPIQSAAHDIFAYAFVDAARLAALLPVAVVVLAALASLAVRARPVAVGPVAVDEDETVPAAPRSAA
jgi:hypothetical protein